LRQGKLDLAASFPVAIQPSLGLHQRLKDIRIFMKGETKIFTVTIYNHGRSKLAMIPHQFFSVKAYCHYL
jgi:hypothetical protein